MSLKWSWELTSVFGRQHRVLEVCMPTMHIFQTRCHEPRKETFLTADAIHTSCDK